MQFKLVLALLSLFILSHTVHGQEITEVRSEGKSKVFYLDGRLISKQKTIEVLRTDPEAKKILNKKPLIIGLVIGSSAVGVIFASRAASQSLDNESTSTSAILAALAGVSAVAFATTLDKVVPRAISKFNANNKLSSIQLGITNSGIGIVYNF